MTLVNLVNDRTAINAIKDTLQTNLEDPREQYVTADRNWIHTDEPLQTATYPRIQVVKRGPTNVENMSLGRTFIERREMILDIKMWSKAPFKWQNTDNAYLQDEELIKEWLHKIWVALKAAQSTLDNTYGITGLRNMGEDMPYIEPDTQLNAGVISVRIWYFRQ